MAEARIWVITAADAWTPVPQLFGDALADHGILGACTRRTVPPHQLEVLLHELRSGVADSCVLTGSLKRDAVGLCDELTPDATRIGAVNVVTTGDGVLRGDSTEAIGFELGLSMHRRWPHSGSRALVLGSGPAAAAAALALCRVPALDVAVASRNETSARDLAQRLAGAGPVHVIPWRATEIAAVLTDAAIVVNTTPLSGDELPVPEHGVPARCTVIDLHRGPRRLDHPPVRGTDGFEPFLFAQLLAFERCTGNQADVARARARLADLLASAPPGEIAV